MDIGRCPKSVSQVIDAELTRIERLSERICESAMDSSSTDLFLSKWGVSNRNPFSESPLALINRLI